MCRRSDYPVLSAVSGWCRLFQARCRHGLGVQVRAWLRARWGPRGAMMCPCLEQTRFVGLRINRLRRCWKRSECLRRTRSRRSASRVATMSSTWRRMAIDGAVLWARQVQSTRSDEYTWGRAELLAVLHRWADLPAAEGATFEFVTDGRLGPTGEEVRQALADAESGSIDALATLIGETPPGERCQRLAGASIRTDRAPVGALLQRAERRLAQLLPQARSEVDLRAEAQRVVDSLFRLLTEHAGNSDAEARTVDRREIASAIGVSEDWTRAERWPGHWRPDYLAKAAHVSVRDSVDPMLSVDVDDILQLLASTPPVEEHVNLETLLSARSPVLLAGPTGTGKTTSCRLVVAHAARTGEVAVYASAEAYLSGRLGCSSQTR